MKKQMTKNTLLIQIVLFIITVIATTIAGQSGCMVGGFLVVTTP